MIIKYLVETCLKRHGDERLKPLKVQDFKNFHLYGFLTTYYNCSPKRALQEAYKEELLKLDIFNNPELIIQQLSLSKIKEPPRGFWTDLSHRQFTTKYLITKLLNKSSDDIYNISAQDFIDHNLGGFLSHYYGCSPTKAILEAYPAAQVFLFNRIDPKIWHTLECRLKALDYFLKLIPEDPRGQTKITMRKLLNLGMKHSLAKFYGGDIKKLLAEAELLKV